jgi:hypothetical protein
MQVTNYEITVMSRILVSKQKLWELTLQHLVKCQQNRNWGQLNHIRECSKLTAEDDKNMIFCFSFGGIIDGILEKKKILLK